MPNEMSDTLRQTALISAADPEFPDLLPNGRPRGRLRHRGPHRSTRQPVRQWYSWDQGCRLVDRRVLLALPPTCDTCWPELRPRKQVDIPATLSPKFCGSRPRKNGHSDQLQPGTPAARNDDWAPTVMTTVAASGRSLEGSASTTSVSERRDACRSAMTPGRSDRSRDAAAAASVWDSRSKPGGSGYIAASRARWSMAGVKVWWRMRRAAAGAPPAPARASSIAEPAGPRFRSTTCRSTTRRNVARVAGHLPLHHPVHPAATRRNGSDDDAGSGDDGALAGELEGFGGISGQPRCGHEQHFASTRYTSEQGPVAGVAGGDAQLDGRPKVRRFVQVESDSKEAGASAASTVGTLVRCVLPDSGGDVGDAVVAVTEIVDYRDHGIGRRRVWAGSPRRR